MPVCWVKAGVCGNETTIEVTRTSPTKVSISFVTTCGHVEALSSLLVELDVGSEMSVPMNETRTYTLAAEHLCRNSCVVPAAILKAVEVAAGIYLPQSSVIEFIDGAL
jgi:hypothetical protein